MSRITGMHDGPFSRLKIALIADSLTSEALAPECNIRQITPLNAGYYLRFWRPDLLFVESAWLGSKGSWKYRIADYPDHPQRNNRHLKKVVRLARDLKIPTVFWNKEDGVHFDRFINSAIFFDYIYTVDSNSIEKYKKHAQTDTAIDTLLFPIQPRNHYFSGFDYSDTSCNFVGSYSRHVHPERRRWQDEVFAAAMTSGLGLTIYDRNSSRINPDYRLLREDDIVIRPAVTNAATAEIYRRHRVSLNVNTVNDSPTMFSRRLLEILACGGIPLTSPARSIELLFPDFCHVANTGDEAAAIFEKFADGIPNHEKERAKAAADLVAQKHTWEHRLVQICTKLGL